MASAAAASRLADWVRIAVATHQDAGARAEDALYVTVRLHESEQGGGGEPRVHPVRSVFVRRLYTGRSKALENDALWDVLVGAELGEGKLVQGTFAYPIGARVSVQVSGEPPVEGAAPFEGVFGLKSVPVPGMH